MKVPLHRPQPSPHPKIYNSVVSRTVQRIIQVAVVLIGIALTIVGAIALLDTDQILYGYVLLDGGIVLTVAGCWFSVSSSDADPAPR